jgi:uncharacterized protein YwgA
MTETQLTREQQLVAYFVNNCDDGRLGRTRLMKLLYLADYESRRFFGRPLTNLQYVWHYYGPYDSTLFDATQELENLGVIVSEQVIYPSGKAGYLYHSGSRSISTTFAPSEVELLSYVVREYSKKELKVLLEDIVYETEPMQALQERDGRGEPLPMDMVNNSRRNELGLDIEQLLERSRRVRAGEYLSHADAMRRLDGVFVNA